jgi:hypothetical protein
MIRVYIETVKRGRAEVGPDGRRTDGPEGTRPGAAWEITLDELKVNITPYLRPRPGVHVVQLREVAVNLVADAGPCG